MLQKLHVENYKAFKTADIPIRPITIFLGANSVGKSSLIQLLLMLQQTGKEGLKSYKSALKLYGGYVNLGDSKNLIRHKKEDSDINISFEIRSKYVKGKLTDDLLENYVDNFRSIPRYIPVMAFKDIRNKEINSVEDLELFIDAFIKLLNSDSAKSEFIGEVKWLLKNRSYFQFGQITEENRKDILAGYNFLKSISKSNLTETYSYSINISYRDNRFYISKMVLTHKEKEILCLNAKGGFELTSDYMEIEDKVVNEIGEHFNPFNTIFSSFDFVHKRNMNSPLSIIICNVFRMILSELREDFSEDKINYVSPLRAHPKRYYMLDKDKVNITLDTLDGDAIADVLKDNSKIKQKVNNWLKRFKLEVDVQEFKEVIHHLKIKQNNLNLDITDVGFGISQVLPVIIQGFLSPDDSTTIIEQPEIHLHPKIQAELADLFIDIVRDSKEKRLIIETHSEYLLKRLRRRISEGKISAKDVSICLFHPPDNGKSAFIENLEIGKKGFFNWPLEFYGGELLKDTTEFLKNQ